MNCGAVFFATSSFACAQIGLQGTVVDEVGAVGPKSSIVVLRIPEVLQKAAPRSLRTPKFSSVRFDREIAVAQGRKDFVIPDAPDGKYRLCAVTDDPPMLEAVISPILVIPISISRTGKS